MELATGELAPLASLPDDPGSYSKALRACTGPTQLAYGRRVHSYVRQANLGENIVLCNHAINMYGRCGSSEEARLVFSQMPRRNTVSWNAIIGCHRQTKERAMRYFYEMLQEGDSDPDKVTVLLALASCSTLADAYLVHAIARESGLEHEVFVSTAIMTMYARCGSVQIARRVFDSMPQRNTVSWTAMITAYSQNGHFDQARTLFRLMLFDGRQKPDRVTYIAVLTACKDRRFGTEVHACLQEAGYAVEISVVNALVNMFGRCGCVAEAAKVFGRISFKNVITWTALISAYAQNGYLLQARRLFVRMQQEGIRPDRVAFLAAMEACTSLTEARALHSCAVEGGLNDKDPESIGNAILTMYARCGNIECASLVFERLAYRNDVSWTALIAANDQNGAVQGALSVFREMQQMGVDPDEVTYVSVLSACSHAGLLEDACYTFYSMLYDYRGLQPGGQHYGCISGLLARIGRLEEAEAMAFKSGSVSTWVEVVGGCGVHGDVDRAQRVINERRPGDSTAYVVLANAYSSS